MFTLVTGFLASMAHVVTGPDHLAAVTPLAIDSRKKSWKIGLGWGIGHTCGMLLIGLLFIGFKEMIPVEFISRKSDFIIGLLLIGIGCWAIARIFIHHSHGHLSHPHVHTRPFTYAHIHAHTHQSTEQPEHNHEHDRKIRQNTVTAFLVGIIHGFAGVSHLVAMLPSLALPALSDTVQYLGAFACGTIITMVSFSVIVGIVVVKSAKDDHPVIIRWFTYCGGILAIGIGFLWLIHPL